MGIHSSLRVELTGLLVVKPAKR